MIDFHGNAMTQHVANRAWDAAKWVAGLRKASRLSSREIYWKVWGLTHFLTCGECGEQFPVCELDHCAHHPRPPHFESGENSGHYPCCGPASLRRRASHARSPPPQGRDESFVRRDSGGDATARWPSMPNSGAS